jgi:hypothetical protein
MAKALAGAPLWSTWEAVLRQGKGPWVPVMSTAFAQGKGDELATTIGKMRILERLGFPAALQSVTLEKADRRKPAIWILKCKPSCWRLYLHLYTVSPTDKRIVYLHAKCKKKDKQDPEDTARARRVLAAANRGDVGRIARFPFPSD